ncbi:MAG: F0F1 ATP synthase subunit B [Legionellales bacterium RIFCSPHIGHO2_12_FULL_37_14]|nr:MAG: F0F1 ATP synthase subunit B [Legionellales bacterium RIFCSPHIGHO2_12_FULL_37_14]
MNLNITLLVQVLVFMSFVWFTMRFVWPPLSKAMEERQDKIADGLAAGERGQRELELAQKRATDELRAAKEKALDIVEKAHKRGADIIEAAKLEAKQQAAHQTKIMQEQLLQATIRARLTLRKEVANLAVKGAEKILQREVDKAANAQLIDSLIEEIEK